MSFLLPSCEEIPPEALPASGTISLPKSDMPTSEPIISKGTIEHSSNCEFLLKIYHLLSFWKSLSSTKLIYTQSSDLRTNLSLNADVSENTLPFVSQSINNFSDYDISQTHDMTGSVPLCPLMFPWVSPDSQVDEALADPVIFRIIFYKSKWRQKKSKISFYNDGSIRSISSHSKRSKHKLSGQSTSPRTKAKKERYIEKNTIHLMTCYMNKTVYKA